MKKYLTLVFLMYTISINSQTFNSVIGRYWVTGKVFNASNVVVKNCTIPNKLDLVKDTYCFNCVYETDSTTCASGVSGWWYNSWHLIVKPDSTLIDSMSNGLNGFGKLYNNDSLFLRLKVGTINFVEYCGFKLYGPSGINELNVPENTLFINPNPSNGIVFIQTVQQQFIKQEPLIYDGLGRLIPISISSINNNTYKADFSAMPTGVYFVFVQSSNGYLKKKLLIQR